MNKSDYPRVLIVGEQFDQVSGGGITLHNLFADWPRECLAFAHARQPTAETLAATTSFYLLGRDEISWPWPLSQYVRLPTSGPVDCDSALYSGGRTTFVPASNRRGLLRKKLAKTVEHLGLHELFVKQCPGPDFIQWVQQFSPDLLYVQLGSIGSINFNKLLTEKTGVPVVVHIMDDWPTYMYATNLSGFLLRKLILAEFEKILRHSVIRLGICKEMCDVYEHRFGGKWLPFHNPVCLNDWQGVSRNNWKAGTPFRIVYSGRIGRGISQSIIDVAKAVSELASEGMQVEFIIRTANLPIDISKIIQNINGVRLEGYLPLDKVPESLAKADLLVIPYDFDPYSVVCSKYSMPTKTAEYMACGTPTLVYAPGDFAISRYALEEGWACTVIENNTDILKREIQVLATDEILRERLGRRAMQMAACNHDASLIRNDFKTVLST